LRQLILMRYLHNTCNNVLRKLTRLQQTHNL
jgi:hypothetical protein